jgi:hypothetical protein
MEDALQGPARQLKPDCVKPITQRKGGKVGQSVWYEVRTLWSWHRFGRAQIQLKADRTAKNLLLEAKRKGCAQNAQGVMGSFSVVYVADIEGVLRGSRPSLVEP